MENALFNFVNSDLFIVSEMLSISFHCDNNPVFHLAASRERNALIAEVESHLDVTGGPYNATCGFLPGIRLGSFSFAQLHSHAQDDLADMYKKQRASISIEC